MSFEKFAAECSAGDKRILAISVCVRCCGALHAVRHTVHLACLANGDGGLAWTEAVGMGFGTLWEGTVLDILPTMAPRGSLKNYLDREQIPMTLDVSSVDSIEKLHR